MVKINLSKTSKLDGIASFSFEAGKTCPGSIDPKTGKVCASCGTCYALGGRYVFNNVKVPRAKNLIESKKDGWSTAMIQELDTHRYFRWFDSGDMYSVEFAKKVLEVCENTPWVKHWLPTRTWTKPQYKTVLQKLNQLPNVVVRYSSGSITGEIVEAQNGSTVIAKEHMSKLQKGIHVCKAYTKENDDKCNGCRACWDKGVKHVAYIAHGRGKRIAREAF